MFLCRRDPESVWRTCRPGSELHHYAPPSPPPPSEFNRFPRRSDGFTFSPFGLIIPNKGFALSVPESSSHLETKPADSDSWAGRADYSHLQQRGWRLVQVLTSVYTATGNPKKNRENSLYFCVFWWFFLLSTKIRQRCKKCECLTLLLTMCYFSRPATNILLRSVITFFRGTLGFGSSFEVLC